MAERNARALARIVHNGQVTAGGSSLFDHVQRVAAAVPKSARVTAWLHEGLERTVDWYRDNGWWWEPIRSGAYREYYQRQYGADAR